MVNVNTKFKVDVDKLQAMQVSVLKATKKIGEKHLEYYYSTMRAFKFPDKRMKCQDTKYYEEVLPIIDKILIDYENKKEYGRG